MFGKVARLDLSGRGYQITPAGAVNNRGWENVVRGDAAVTMRLFGPHAVTVKYLVTRRNAHYPQLGVVDQRRGTIGVFYTVVGNRRLGAVE